MLIVRSQGSFPAVGEVFEPFEFPQSVQGWMRGSHFGPLMPCSVAQSNLAADYLRSHGPFEPHRLPLEEMDYTTMPKVMKKLRGRCSPIG